MVRMYQKKLVNDGVDVETAEDGEEALEKITSFDPDLLLLDIMMPKKNGLEVLEEMKNSDKMKNIPVILLTNVSGSEEDIERGLELGAVAYLTKAGNRPDAVLSKVKEILKGATREIPQVKSKITSTK